MEQQEKAEKQKNQITLTVIIFWITKEKDGGSDGNDETCEYKIWPTNQSKTLHLDQKCIYILFCWQVNRTYSILE